MEFVRLKQGLEHNYIIVIFNMLLNELCVYYSMYIHLKYERRITYELLLNEWSITESGEKEQTRTWCALCRPVEPDMII